MSQNVILYSAKLCGDCQRLKAFMDAQGIEYDLRDIKENPAYAELVKSETGKLGVPYLVIDGQWVRGYPLGEAFTDEFAASLFE